MPMIAGLCGGQPMIKPVSPTKKPNNDRRRFQCSLMAGHPIAQVSPARNKTATLTSANKSWR